MFISSSAGARTDGEGEGSDVKYGFCCNAACRGAREEGGVINVISERVSLPKSMSHNELIA